MTRPVLLSYRTLGLGDLLTAVPALRALRRAYPDHRHLLAAPAWLGPLVSGLDAVDQHVEVPELGAVPAQLAAPDVAANLHGSGPQSHRRLLATDPGRLLAFSHPDVDAGRRCPRWRDDEHEVDRWCRMLSESGVPADPHDLHLDVPEGPRPSGARGAVVIHPGAKSPARRWPVERFAEVARRLAHRGWTVLVTGSEDERPLAAQLAGAADLPDEAVLAGGTDLGALARVVASAALLVSGDTGVAHLATAVRTPSVVLFGPTPPRTWGPPVHLRDRHRVLWAGRTGDPLGETTHPGLLEIGVDDVIAEVDALAQRRGLPPAA